MTDGESTAVRIAMWSGPRNISTALMRAWGERPDTVVVDEPLYAHYLKVTGKPHPAAEEVIAHGRTDWRQVAADLLAPLPEGKRILYQKHMAHHLLPDIERDWIARMTNVFLIRDPAEMLTSYVRIVEAPTLEDLAFPQQAELFNWLRERTGRTPPVLDAKDVLQNPRRLLGLLCDAVGVEFDECMLSWPPGPRPTDGVWAPHWYSAVWKSTGFQPYRPKNEPVPAHLEPLLEPCYEYYSLLYEHRLH